MWLAVLLLFGLPLTGLTSSAWAASELFPDAAPPGATVAISGEGFGEFRTAEYNRVLFNKRPALVQRWEPDLLEVRVPLKAKSGSVEVHLGDRTIPVGRFTVLSPTITDVTPHEVAPGGALTIAGKHFGPTAGPRDPNTMFGVNDVLVGGVPAKIQRWRDDGIEVKLPANAESGEVIVRLASSDPLPDGSCCAPVDYAVSNPVPVKVIPPIRVDPLEGPVGTKIVLFGEGFGEDKTANDGLLLNGRPTTIAQWTDKVIVAHLPIGATSGELILRAQGKDRPIGTFTVVRPEVTELTPQSGPIGSLLRIKGKNFGTYSDAGSTPYSFIDFDKGENGVEIGGVPAIIYRWNEDRIDVWVPYSAKSGPVVIKRGGTVPKEDGTCCVKTEVMTTVAGEFSVVMPTVESFTPTEAGLDEIVTIKGSGFGSFLKTMEETQAGLNERGHDAVSQRVSPDVSRTEVLFAGVAGIVVSWTDTEIKAQVPHRHVFGFGVNEKFVSNSTTGPLVVRRGSWDLLPDGSCCTDKRWVTVEAGEFTVLPRGLPDQTFYTEPNPRRD